MPSSTAHRTSSRSAARVATLAIAPAIALAIALVALHAGTGAAHAADAAALQAIQAATGGKLKATKGRAQDADCGQAIDYEAEAVDLNGDGRLEVLTQEFGSCFGRAGVQMNLYIQAPGGQWQAQFGFPGSPKLLKTRSHGYPDIEVLGPGTCFPVWRYNGRAYQPIKTCR
jgi:hypothetical protein